MSSHYVYDKDDFRFRKQKRSPQTVLLRILKYFLVSVSLAVLYYAVFALFFSTDKERRLKAENRMYERMYPEMEEKQQLLEDVVAGLEVKDNSIYRDLFQSDVITFGSQASDFLSGIGCIALVLGGFGGIISLIVYLVALVVGRRITRRNMVRIWLSVSYSPLILLFLVVVGSWAYSYYGRKHEFADKERLERITGVAYPDYKIGWYRHGGHSFNGDYSDEAGIKFEEAPSAGFYRCLDSLAAVKDSHWSRQKDGTYSFRYIWGNGSPAPKGESDEEDMSLHVKIRKGSKWAEIEYGAW